MAYRSSTTLKVDGGGAGDPGKPAGTVSSDILIMSLSGFYGDADSPTPPAGWTLISFKTTGGANGRIAVYWALGSVSSTSFTTGIGGTVILICSAWSDRDTTNPVTAFSEDTNLDAGFGNVTAFSVTAASGDDSVCIYYNRGTVDFGAPSGGYTEAANNGGGTSLNWQSVSYKNNVTAGATGDQTRTGNGFFDREASVQVSIKAAASVPTITAFQPNGFM